MGDLGNIQTDANGNVKGKFTDSVISLWDAVRNIANRSVVIHCSPDDLGEGSSIAPFSSNTTGNAGNRTACAVIVAQ